MRAARHPKRTFSTLSRKAAVQIAQLNLVSGDEFLILRMRRIFWETEAGAKSPKVNGLRGRTR
jgi:hypothetical protein